MKLSEYALDLLKIYVTGDNGRAPNQKGTQLVALFNSAGCRDRYSGGLPDGLSRNAYVLNRLLAINGTKGLKVLLETVFSPRHFSDPGIVLDNTVVEVNNILKPEGYELIKSAEGIYTIASADASDEETSSAIHFEKLEAMLIEEIKKAKYTIWVAVAWFTNKKLYDLLVEKYSQGLSVQVIILDDDINRNCGLHDKPKIYTVKMPLQGPYKNFMHNKFCVIDLKTVVHGSYNWTYRANYNNETLDIETSRENAEKFADEFMRLKALRHS